jgi:ribosome-binding protein aMBF1 (putative translation factor)
VALKWIARKFRVHLVSGEETADTVRIEDTDFYREMEVNRVGNLLEGARLKAGMSQKKLADAVGIRQTMVSEFENGRRRITKRMAKRFADVLKVKAERLA